MRYPAKPFIEDSRNYREYAQDLKEHMPRRGARKNLGSYSQIAHRKMTQADLQEKSRVETSREGAIYAILSAQPPQKGRNLEGECLEEAQKKP